MRVVSVNVNGIRSAQRKGFFAWLHERGADVVCVQETKAQAEQLRASADFWPAGYYCHYRDAEKKGYSGVAIYSKQQPDAFVESFGAPEFDAEGRFLEARFGELSVISLYLPSGSSGEVRQRAKFRALDVWAARLNKMADDGRKYIICGDWNIAHKAIDLKNWRANQTHSGFLPEEREWMERLFGTMRFVDAFREVDGRPDQYTWWSNRGQAWAKNVGWRIDYHVLSPNLRGTAKSAEIYKDMRFSDHAPLTIDYQW